MRINLERPRRDAVGDYLLGGSVNSAIDRTFAADLVAAHPHLPRWAIAAACWDRDAAQAMLDQQIRHFLILGTGGFPIWSSHSTLTTLHQAGARIVVIEHDPVTRHLHDLVDRGAAVGRAHLLCVAAESHHALAAQPAVTPLLTGDTPLGILATGLLRPSGIHVATILSLLNTAPTGSLAAITQLTHHDNSTPEANDVSALAAPFAEAGIPIAVDDHLAADQLLNDFAHLNAEPNVPSDPPRDAASSCLRTVLHHRRPPRAATADLPAGAAPCRRVEEPGASR